MEREMRNDRRRRPSRRVDERRHELCVSCGKQAKLQPEPVFGGLRICEECSSHVHVPSDVDCLWIGNSS